MNSLDIFNQIIGECKNHKITKPLDTHHDYDTTIGEYYDDEISGIRKELEILDILKNKKVDVEMISYCDYVESYNKALRPKLHLTKEEFDLLKEWLNEN